MILTTCCAFTSHIRGFTRKAVGRLQMTSRTASSLCSFGLSADNSFIRTLVGEDSIDEEQKRTPRQVSDVHFTFVAPEPVSSPKCVLASESLAKELGLSVTELSSEQFARAFSGNELLPGLDQPWASVYGCHCYGIIPMNPILQTLVDVLFPIHIFIASFKRTLVWPIGRWTSDFSG